MEFGDVQVVHIPGPRLSENGGVFKLRLRRLHADIEAGEAQRSGRRHALVSGGGAQIRSFPAPFKRCIDTAKTYVATITTNKGVLIVNLDTKAAPLTVNNFVALARNKYFDGLSCHRIIPAFVAQCGDPLGTGRGGPGYKIVDELPKAGTYKVGSLAMANSGPNTNGSQFFVITGASGAALPPSYSLFGLAVNSNATITALDAAGSSANNGVPPKQAVTITSVVITER